MLTVVPDPVDGDRRAAANSGSPASSSSLIDEIVREGARRMLTEALKAEVEAYIAQFATDPHRGRRDRRAGAPGQRQARRCGHG
jgi:hypothetical protein